jgi:hypothetical protein
MFRVSAREFPISGARLLASGLVVVLLLVSVLSASDVLHRVFHHNARQGTSVCAVCLLMKGHIEPRVLPAALLVFSLPWVSLTARTVAVQPPGRFLSTPSRGPPAPSSFHSVAI